jgi:type II secretory pathway pseudopilin PulG
MQLAGQGIAGNRGYAMVMLLVAMGVMAVVWTTALPAWSQLAKREKEEELIFRGNQYARAIGLFQRKYANQSPPSLDVLLEQKFLRRKYKDPMVADGQFQLLYQTVQQPGSSGRGQSQSQGPQGRSNQPSQGPQGRSNQPSGFGTPGGIAVPGQVTGAPIIGVTSKSKEESLRTYNGATHYNEWQFIYLATTQQPGAPGGPGGPGAQPDGRGRGGRGSRGEPFELGGRGGRGRGSQEEGPDGRRMFGPDPGRGRGTGQPPSRGFGFPPSDSDFDFPQPPPPPGR